MDSAERLKQRISGRFDGSDVFLYWKGRVGLYSVLRAWGVGPGDEVILPAFTCVVVPNAVLYLGAKPVYVDIDARTLNATLDRIKSAKTDKTKAVICQNTFGLSSEVDAIAQWAVDERLLSIEDCTHGFGGTYRGRPNGSYCDAAFFSSQWNKPVSSGIGGFVVTKNPVLAQGLRRLEANLAEPGMVEVLGLRMQIWARKHLLTERTYWRLLKAYRWLSKTGVIAGSSSGEEIDGTTMPKDYFKGMSALQAGVVVQELDKIGGYNGARRAAADQFTEFLSRHEKYHVDPALADDHMYLKYPILVADRQALFQAAEQARVELGDWFNSPLHPVQNDLSGWGLQVEQFPQATRIAAHIVNLPTRSDTDRVIGFLERHLDELL